MEEPCAWVAPSDDEGDGWDAAPCAPAAAELEEVCSDSDEERPAFVHPQATAAPQAALSVLPAPVAEGGGVAPGGYGRAATSRPFVRAAGVAPVLQPRLTQQRGQPLLKKTRAAAEADRERVVAAEAAAAAAAELAAYHQEPGGDAPEPASENQPPLPAPSAPAAKASNVTAKQAGRGLAPLERSFLNRPELASARHRQLPAAPQPEQQQYPPERPADDLPQATAAPRAPPAIAQCRDLQQQHQHARGQAGAAEAGPAADNHGGSGTGALQERRDSHAAAEPIRPAAAAPVLQAAATLNRTADGLNVLVLNRQAAGRAAAEHDGSSGPGRASKSVNSGWGNNFVRIDLKKGRGSTKYGSKYGSKKRSGGRGGRGRWQAAPRLRQVGDGAEFLEGWRDSKMRCFKCGGAGHWAKDCTAAQQAQADADALCGNEAASSGDEGEAWAAGGVASMPQQQLQQGGQPQYPRQQVQVPLAGQAATPPAGDVAEQYAETLADPSEVALTAAMQGVFGFSSFRGLQLQTIQRLLAGESLLSIMPTGMGKSLCYQLPALLLPGLTLVVSPLVALMHDQRASVPAQISAAVLWSGQTRADALQVLADVAAGRIKVLFVSPERLNNPHLLAALAPCMPLPLVVVDEAHCVAEWGHSFRPAYFRLGAALQGIIRAQRVLALTATATRATERAVRDVLRIRPASVLRDSAVRANLRLRVVRQKGGGSGHATWERVAALLVPGGELESARAAIVYCCFKEDANQLAKLLCNRGIRAAAYHAGRNHKERAAIEQEFGRGRLRVVAATVAFGMGVDIARVDAVLHATLPRSLEEYVQQVGRAGRDGSEARCTAFLDDANFVRLRSLAYGGVLDLAAVRGFLGTVFAAAAAAGVAGASKQQQRRAPKGRKRKAPAAAGSDEEGQVVPDPAAGDAGELEQAAAAPAAAEESALQQQAGRRQFGVLPTKKLAAELDMREESMEAVLSYLEADAAPCIRMLPASALSVRVSFYAGTPEELAKGYPVVRAVLAACPRSRNGVHTAPAARLAAEAQKAPGLVLQELRDMAAGSLIGFEVGREEGPAYEVLRQPACLDTLAEEVYTRLTAVLACQVSRLDTCYRGLAAATAAELGVEEQEAALREAVECYFDGQDTATGSAAAASERAAGSSASCLALDTAGLPLRRVEPALLQAARAVVRRNREQAGPELSARAVARILHGVSSPAFPTDSWAKRMGAFWGSHSSTDFGAVFKAAEIVLRDDSDV